MAFEIDRNEILKLTESGEFSTMTIETTPHNEENDRNNHLMSTFLMWFASEYWEALVEIAETIEKEITSDRPWPKAETTKKLGRFLKNYFWVKYGI